jgi:hypothetical protein
VRCSTGVFPESEPEAAHVVQAWRSLNWAWATGCWTEQPAPPLGKRRSKLPQRCHEQAAAMLSDAQYLDSSPSTDGEEIKKLLNSTLEREKLDGMKHLIALISLGHDASDFFPQAVKNVVAGSVELKRLVYMYLVHYAEVRSSSARPFCCRAFFHRVWPAWRG